MVILKGLLTLHIIVFGLMLLPFLQSDSVAADSPLINRFSHIYEPSGVICLPGGDLLVIEDDGSNPLYIIPIVDNSAGFLGTPEEMRLSTSVDDIEGITSGRNETIFLITSFSPTKKNKRKKKRQRLLQFQINDDKIIREFHFDNLLPYLIGHLANEKYVGSKGADALNIEGITFDRKKEHLLIGLRSPLRKGKAVIVVLENPYELLSDRDIPVFSPRNIILDLGGEGIRGMVYDDLRNGYLITNEVRNRKGKLRPGLWFWEPSRKPVRIPLPKMKGVKNIEGIAPITIASRHFLFLVWDDGERKRKKGAHYILIER